MANSQPPEYDSIGSQYTDIKQFPLIKYTETAAFRELAKSFIAKSENVRILDLACGTGYYANLLSSWGATEVTGIDISTVMIEAANSGKLPPGKQLKFLVGDALDLRTSDLGGPFPMVTGVWLLTCASSKEEMVKVFRGISANLEPGGVFVGIAPEPVENMDEFVRKHQGFLQDEGPYDFHVDYFERLVSGEGYKFRVAVRQDRPFQFESRHLKQSVYEAAAREGGMTGPIEWDVLQPSDEGIALLGEEFWAGYSGLTPKFSTLVVRK